MARRLPPSSRDVGQDKIDGFVDGLVRNYFTSEGFLRVRNEAIRTTLLLLEIDRGV